MPLRVIEFPESIWETDVGDMWRVPARDLPDREAWLIHCPGDVFWCTTSESTKEGEGLWKVSGEPPNITVEPSINAEPMWHGRITGGEFA